MPYTFERPPELRDLNQVYSYLYRMSEELEGALNNLTASDVKDLSTKVDKAITAATAGKATTGALAEYESELRSLIIMTAETAHEEMERVQTELHGNYVATSDFGSVSEQYFQSIASDALANENIYQYMSRIQSGNEEFQTEVQARIRMGFLYVDDQGLPVYGVAIGREVLDKSYTYTDPDTHETVTETGVDTTKTLSIFTSDKLEFWIGDNLVAYINNQELYITRGRFLREIRIGSLAGVIDGTDSRIVRWYVKR